jgi:hypothetical protein
MRQPCRSAAANTVAFAVALVASGLAGAASQRSFVSTSGVDNPACSVASPCRTFAAAVAATLANGEVIVLNSGGYGPVTIAKSVSIIAPPGVYAGISVSSGSGVTLATSVTDSVTLRGLTINNVGAGETGIQATGDGRLQVEDVHVTGFLSGAGLGFAPPSSGDLVVERSSFSGNNWGIVITNLTDYPTDARALLDRVTTHHNAAVGVLVNEADVVLRGSTAAYNGVGAVVWSTGALPSTNYLGRLTVETSNLSHNGTGLMADGFVLGANTAEASLSHSVVTQNGTGVRVSTNGIVTIASSSITGNVEGIVYIANGAAKSQGNNLISGNTTDGTAPTIVGSK